MTLPETVRALHAERPTWTAVDMGRHLGKSSNSISNAARRGGIDLPKAKRGRKPSAAKCKHHPNRPMYAHGLCNACRQRARYWWRKAGSPRGWKDWARGWAPLALP